MQRPGSALSKLRIQQQNLHANVTQKSVQKKSLHKRRVHSTKGFRRSYNSSRTRETFNERQFDQSIMASICLLSQR